MSTHQEILLHWTWAAVFLGLAVVLIVRRDSMTRVSRAFCSLNFGGSPSAGEWDERIDRAVERRQAAEGKPAQLGLVTGGVSIALSAVSAFSSVPVALLYAILCLVITLAGARAFLQLRNSQRTRVAVLSARTTDKVVSPLWFVLAVLCAISVLVFAEIPQWTVPSILVCASALLTAAIAWRLTMLGAILTGDDLAAERFVDDRLRSYRTSIALALSYIQPLVFATQMPGRFHGWQWAAIGICCISFLAFAVLQFRTRRQDVHLA